MAQSGRSQPLDIDTANPTARQSIASTQQQHVRIAGHHRHRSTLQQLQHGALALHPGPRASLSRALRSRSPHSRFSPRQQPIVERHGVAHGVAKSPHHFRHRMMLHPVPPNATKNHGDASVASLHPLCIPLPHCRRPCTSLRLRRAVIPSSAPFRSRSTSPVRRGASNVEPIASSSSSFDGLEKERQHVTCNSRRSCPSAETGAGGYGGS